MTRSASSSEGFKSVVVMAMTSEAGEHHLEIRPGSILELADRVAKRCIEVLKARGEMNDEIYDEVVMELAPHFAQPTA